MYIVPDKQKETQDPLPERASVRAADSYHSVSALLLNVSGSVHGCVTRLMAQDVRNHPGASISLVYEKRVKNLFLRCLNGSPELAE